VSLAPLVLDAAPPPPLDLIGDADDYHYERFADYLAALDRAPAALNAACLVGHSTLRVGAMSALDRPADKAEVAQMGERLQEALAAGAIGLSSGLAYAPASHAPAAEIEELAALLRPARALYTTHMRNEADAVVASLEESFAAGRAAGVPVVISHHKTVGRENFGRTVETLPLLATAIARQEIGLDAYPYIASSTVLSATQAARALKVLVTWSKSAPEQAGRELSAIAADWGVSDQQAADRLQPAGAVYWMMDEADVQRVLQFPYTMIGSDGLQPRARPLQPRRGGAPDDRPVRVSLWSYRPRRPRTGRLCRRDRLRPGNGRRSRDLRGADDPRRRHRARVCQRSPGVDRWQPHRGTPGPRAAPPTAAGRGAGPAGALISLGVGNISGKIRFRGRPGETCAAK